MVCDLVRWLNTKKPHNYDPSVWLYMKRWLFIIVHNNKLYNCLPHNMVASLWTGSGRAHVSLHLFSSFFFFALSPTRDPVHRLCGHLSGRSWSFNCLPLFFIRRWSRLVTRHLAVQGTTSSQTSLLTSQPHCLCLMKTSSKQSKHIQLKWLHYETNDNAIIIFNQIQVVHPKLT